MARRMMCRALAALALASLFARPLHADETENLTALARVWAAAKFLDPALATSDIDWDGALLRAIPKARAARTDADLADAVGAMLAELHDPASRIVKSAAAPSKPAEVPLTRTDGEVLVVNFGSHAARNGIDVATELRRIAKDVANAKFVVVDLRGGNGDEIDYDFAMQQLPWSDVAISAPNRTVAYHSGYAPQVGGTSGGYYSGLLEVSGRSFSASPKAPQRIAFIADRRSGVPDVALALRDAGRAFFAASEPLGDELAFNATSIDLPGGVQAEVRISQFRNGNVSVDVIDPDPVAASIAALRGQRQVAATPQRAKAPAAPHWRADDQYASMTYPDVEHRILAATRLWAVIHYFYPYLDLIGDWDATFKQFIPRFIAAANADEYARAVVEMDTHVEDGHSFVSGPEFVQKLFGGPGRVPAEVRVVENEFVVTHSDVPELHAGDIVESIDGQPFRERVEQMRALVTGSRELPRTHRAAAFALRGPSDSTATLAVRGANGPRTVSVKRVPFKMPDASNPYRVLEGNIGYVDLTKLTPADVDAMFDELAKTSAIILDMRGYPRGTAWPIAPRINTRHAKIGAEFRRREVSGMNLGSDFSVAGFYFDQPLPKADKPLYTGRIVTLIDDRAVSQSEHSCLFYEQAAGSKFIGTTTAGANGDVTNLVLPGAIVVSFTGHDVRHADGRQLQRVGIKPDIEVAPTIAGIRAGRDEVLERAVQYLNAGPR
ncbi:MAG TPA: S41 family peptidase [Thermoanaerobaculia bacterium]